MNAIDELAIQLTIDHQLGEFLNLRPIAGGSVNQVYLLETDLQKVILRINKPGEYTRFEKEAWAARAAASNGVQVPRPLHVGKNDAHAYMILTYIAGKNGKDIDPVPDLWRKLGASLKLIHEIPVSGFGEALDDIRTGSPNEWQRYIQYNIASLNADDVLLAQGILDADSSKKLRIIF